MSRHRSVDSKQALLRWTEQVQDAFPNLSKPQATGLAWWSFGMVLARSCSLPAVALLLAKLLADRGLWARWLFEGIRKLNWHPMLRIKRGGRFRPHGWVRFVPLTSLAPRPGSRWRGQGTAFATPGAQLDCTLLAFWGEGHEEVW